MVNVHRNFLDSATTNILLNYAKKFSEEEWQATADIEGIPSKDFWHGRFVHAIDIEDDDIKRLLIENRYSIMKEIKKTYKIEKDLYGDLLQFVRWPQGYELFPHADAEEPDGSPHPFPWREYACVTYLNNDFKGGNIYFPTRDNFSPPIEPGTMVFFPGTVEYLHGVKAVTDGVRYTIASFFTTDAKRGDPWDTIPPLEMIK